MSSIRLRANISKAMLYIIWYLNYLKNKVCPEIKHFIVTEEAFDNIPMSFWEQKDKERKTWYLKNKGYSDEYINFALALNVGYYKVQWNGTLQNGHWLFDGLNWRLQDGSYVTEPEQITCVEYVGKEI